MRRCLRMEPLEARQMLTMVAVPSSTMGELSTFGEVDSYTFIATGGENYYITAEFMFTTTLDPDVVGGGNLSLLDEDGEFVATGSGRIGVRPLTFIRWNAAADGIYELQINEGGSEKGAYTLNVELATDDHGNTFDEATEVSVPSATPGSFATDDDVDMFSFSSTAGGHYRVLLDGGGLIKVYDSDGELLFFHRCSNRRCDPPDFSFVTPDANDYFVAVVGAANYRLDIESVNPFDDHGNTPASATLLTNPAVTAGEFEVPGDTDFFAFEAAAGQRYNISTLFVDEVNNIASSKVRIYDTDGASKLVHDDRGVIDTTDGTFSSLTSWTAPEDGTYFVELITPNVEFSNLGRVDPRIVVGDYVIRVATADEDDHAADASAATPITVPSKTTGRFEFPGDVDIFSFEMVAGQRYGLHLDARFEDTISLLDVDGVTVLESMTLSRNAEPIDWTAPADGLYFLQVGSEFTVDQYSFAVHLPCDLIEIGDGCNILDMRALQSNADVTNESIQEWLMQASRIDNALKARPEDVYRMGDVDLDGDVDSTDLGQLLNHFSNEQPSLSSLWGEGNLNTDYRVDSTDLGLLLNELGFASSPAALATSAGSLAASGFAMSDLVFSGYDEDENDDSVETRLR